MAYSGKIAANRAHFLKQAFHSLPYSSHLLPRWTVVRLSKRYESTYTEKGTAKAKEKAPQNTNSKDEADARGSKNVSRQNGARGGGGKSGSALNIAGDLKSVAQEPDKLNKCQAPPSEQRSPNKAASQSKSPIKKAKSRRRALSLKNTVWATLPLAKNTRFRPVEGDPASVPQLSYGLERVLFNPGVYRLQDHRTKVYNFDPYLEDIMPVSQFDFDALRKYTTSSEDQNLLDIARKHGKRFTGSTSSLTSILSHFHFLLSGWRAPNMGMLSADFPDPLRSFTLLSRGPAASFLRYRDDIYAVDADKEFSTSSVLSMLGRSMEKMLTLETKEFERFRKSNGEATSGLEPPESEAYHFTTIGDFVLRSQLDARDPRLPGTGMFDLKTRAVVSIRMNVDNYMKTRDYEIISNQGEWESFEREYHDMIRAAFLKYSLQVRMGRMDGIFVAYHNTQRIFGFQYIPLAEMDYAVHGQTNTTLGDSEFLSSMQLLNTLIEKSTARFPGKSLRLLCETRGSPESPFMYFFAEPVSEEDIETIQNQSVEDGRRFEAGISAHRSESEKNGSGDSSEAEAVLAQHMQDENCVDPEQLINAYDDPSQQVTKYQDEEQEIKPLQSPLELIDPSDPNISQERNGKDASQDRDAELLHFNDDLSAKLTADVSPIDLDIVESLEGAADASLEVEPGKSDSVADPLLVDDEDMEDDDDDEVENEEGAEGAEGANELSDNETIQMDAVDEVGAPDESDSADPSEPSFAVDESSAPGADEDKPIDTSPELMGVVVRVRHIVGEKSVLRPQKLTSSSKWTIKYSIEEIENPIRRWEKYRACKKRNVRVVTKARDFASSYMRKLEALSRKGKKHRDQMMAEQEGSRTVIVGSPPLPRGT